MTSSHASSHLRRAALDAALAFHTAWSLVACATVVEEPSAMGDVDASAGLVSTTGGPTSTTNSASNVTHTATMAATSAVTSTTGTPTTTNSVSSSSAAATSTSTSSSTVNTAASVTGTTASATVSSTTATSSVGGATTGSFATTVTDGAGGSSASTTSVTNSTTGSTSEYCDDPLTPAEHVGAEGTTGAFDTNDGVCYRLDFVPADFAGWGCSNFQASTGNRTILVNGTSVTCGQLPLPEPVDGGYYFDFGPGTNVSAAMYWWNWE